MPFGSEGSVQYDIVKTRKESEYGMGLYWGHIVIWGDLRDFDNPHAIWEWLFNSLATINDDGIGFRQAIVTIEVEYQGTHLIVLNEETQKLKLLST